MTPESTPAGEYVRGEVDTNTVEGFFSIFKRGMKGIYQHCSEAHLHRYLAEFDFRYPTVRALALKIPNAPPSSLNKPRASASPIGGTH